MINILNNPYIQGAAIYGLGNMFGSAIIASIPKPEEVKNKDGSVNLWYRTFYSLLSAAIFDFKSISAAVASGKTVQQAIISAAVNKTNTGTE